MNEEQSRRMASGQGFIAALDQSGGSTPKALRLYGVDETGYANEEQMFDLIHQMRSRIITSPAFDGDRILGAILFEMTMDREIAGLGSAEYLWQVKGIVPFVKVDRGLAEERDGVQLMKPIPGLGSLLTRAIGHGVFGTKMRSVINLASPGGIDAVISQQFDIAAEILTAGLVPIIEPEVSIGSTQKSEAEKLMKDAILARLGELSGSDQIMLKLTLPDIDGFYSDLIGHPRVLRVVALSGGYSRAEASTRLARNHGLIASFSRALTEGLTAQQDDTAFDSALDASIETIYRASIT
jgi:fructose-bisphosphate aldolase class I